MEKNKKRSKSLYKIIACILTIIMIVQVFSPIVYGMNETDETQDIKIENKTDNTDDNNKVNSDKLIGEIIEKRKLNQKFFLQEDGNIRTAIYPMNIHYEQDGKLLDIDNSLESTNESGEIYQNKNNFFKVKFSKKANKNNLVKIKVKNHNIKWSLLNSNKVNATTQENNKLENNKLNLNNISSGNIQYENILENIDIQYNVVSDSIKENIVLKNELAINQEIAFEFQTDNLIMEKTEGNKIIFSKENEEEVQFLLEAPYMYAKNEICDDIEIELTKKNNNKYIMKLKPNKEWLESKDREYPIIIDPTVETSLNYQKIQDTYIFEGDASYPNRHRAHILRVGSNNKLPSKGPTRSLIKFELPNLNAGDQVVNAMLDICSYPDTEEWAPPTHEMQINVHKMTTDWEVSTANWNALNNQYDSKVTDYVRYKYDNNNPVKFYYFDITSIVKDWYVTGNNYGLLLKDRIETYNYPNSDAYFFSANVNVAYINARPMIQIVYRNQTGIEDYQTYHTQDMGRAGNIYTNDYNGNLVLTHQDASTSGNLLTASINHVYNTNNKDSDIGYGKGYKLNLTQIISLVTINNIQYAKYIDEDATEHYLKRDGTTNTYKDEDGLDLTLNLENDTFIMKDKENNICTFQKRTNSFGEKWHLKELKDSFGNKITLQLNQNTEEDFRIEKVTDATGEELNLTYDVGTRLQRITDKAGRITTYNYNSNGNMTQITYNDGKVSKYSYNNLNLLTSVKNIDNSRIDFEYYNEKSNRIKSLKEYSQENELGKTLNTVYGSNITKFTNNEGYTNIYTFNNLGQTISIGDLGKNSDNIDSAYGKMYQYGEKESNKNKLILDGKLMSIKEKTNNLVQNGDFSQGENNWRRTDWEANDQIIDGKCKLIGNSDKDKNIWQILYIAGKKGDIFDFAGWVKSNAVPNNTEKATKISFSLHFLRNDGTRQIIDTNVNVDGSEWQFLSKVVTADSDYNTILIYLVSSYNENETYFDNIGLFKEEYGQSYTYDSNGNLISTEENAQNTQKFKYNSNNKLIESINPKGGIFTYNYDNNNPQKLNSATNVIGNKYTFEYDKYGNITSTKVFEDTQSDIGVEYDTHISNEGVEREG